MRVAMLVLAVQDRERGERPAGAVRCTSPLRDPVHDRHGLVLRAGADEEGDRLPVRPLGHEPLVGLEAGLVAGDQAVGPGQDVAHRPEVLLDPEARWRTGRGRSRIVGGWAREPGVELGEGGEAGAPEPVDRLVVVAHDHDVVGPVRRSPEQLDELDLGDVGVLELVHEQVPELALPAAQDVGARLEQLRDGGDLLAEVEGAAAGELLLVGAVDDRELVEAQDLEGGPVDDVAGSQGIDARVVPPVELVATDRAAGTGDRAARLATGDLLGGVGLVRAGLAPGFRPLVGPDARVGAANGPQGGEVALDLEPRGGGRVAPVPGLEREAFTLDERVEVVRRDQLVLGAVDELDEVAEGPAPLVVVDERQVRTDVPQQQHLADAVEDVGSCGQAGVGRRFGEDPLAEAVEVRDSDPRPRRATHRFVQAFLQLPRSLDVVGEDEELFGEEVRPVLEEVPDTLDDHARLAGPGARDHDERPIAELDDAPLLRCQLVGHVAPPVGRAIRFQDRPVNRRPRRPHPQTRRTHPRPDRSPRRP